MDTNVADVGALLQRSKSCGVTRLLLTDSKFSRLADMDARCFMSTAWQNNCRDLEAFFKLARGQSG